MTYHPLKYDVLCDSIDEQCTVAKNPHAPVDVLGRLTDSPHDSVRRFLAGNPKTPPGALKRLSRDTYVNVRSGVAGNPKTPPGVILTLIGDVSHWVRVEVVANCKVSVKQLEKLAVDESVMVRSAVAVNPKTSVQVLRKLVQDRALAVRNNVALNWNTPLDAMLTPVFLNLSGWTPLRMITGRDDFMVHHARAIIYGDFNEDVIKAVMLSGKAGDSETTYVQLKFGGAHNLDKNSS